MTASLTAAAVVCNFHWNVAHSFTLAATADWFGVVGDGVVPPVVSVHVDGIVTVCVTPLAVFPPQHTTIMQLSTPGVTVALVYDVAAA